ncbi:ribonuclease H-like domain-containing protein [Anaerovorax sp. IOR16]|uniref:ribonuclease H-like domain-containing protein n=1 Tax=Anaerovorax sp. IOR16 TaxID=2773458 RepID=UPI0019D0CFA7|nr:ribonuclease H-like domain-containing protein [Anaerovorax sp. IOR16]
MSCKTNTNQNNKYISKPWALYTQDLSLGFFDIETTGLSPKQDSFILGGLLSQNNDSMPFKITQYFAETPFEEANQLEQYLADLSKQDIWISYNGDSFDLSFLAKRMKQLGLSEILPFHYSFDLYRILRQFSSIGELLPNLKQKTVESFLGIENNRTDQISGKESTLLYERYQKEPLEEIKHTILLHNQDDVIQLSALLKILDKLNLHQIMFQRGFLCTHKERKVKIEHIYFDKNFLFINGKSNNILLPYQSYEMTHQMKLDSKMQTFELKVPYISENNFTYIDLESFNMDFSPLQKYNGYQSGYLILHDGSIPNYLEINHALKIILKEILKQF